MAGNTCLYGATSGRVLIGGVVGERFAVRNSGAEAVCEGLGDHGCEYMTGGTVVVLGSIGRNFAAGMTGGMAYIYDKDHCVRQKISAGAFTISEVVKKEFADNTVPKHQGKYDEDILKELITEHMKYTGSCTAEAILNSWDTEIGNFIKVFPLEYYHALQKLQEAV